MKNSGRFAREGPGSRLTTFNPLPICVGAAGSKILGPAGFEPDQCGTRVTDWPPGCFDRGL